MDKISGRMKAIVHELVLEARRSGFQMAQIRFESEVWNDEGDKTYSVFVDGKNKRFTYETEE